jgi:hypothetical protein
MWGLWWTKRHWGRFSPSTSVSLATHSTIFSIIIITWGWHNRPISGCSAKWAQPPTIAKFFFIEEAIFFVLSCCVKKYQFLHIICRYIVIEVNPTNMKHDAALILKPTSLYFSITKKVQQLHGDFGVAATKSGLAGMFIAVNRPSGSDFKS